MGILNSTNRGAWGGTRDQRETRYRYGGARATASKTQATITPTKMEKKIPRMLRQARLEGEQGEDGGRQRAYGLPYRIRLTLP